MITSPSSPVPIIRWAFRAFRDIAPDASRYLTERSNICFEFVSERARAAPHEKLGSFAHL